ncbi:MAG TPA: class I SAM-dependent methyltransferase [Crocinitomicaceae bacterium]|nr:class I SAM-dependent methyltransferase [Crocinitomicaceae bacterium]
MDKNKQAVRVFNDKAIGYEEKYMDVSSYKVSLNKFCDELSISQPKILELACGPGNITQFLLDKRPGFQVDASDLSKNMIKLAQKNNHKAQFSLFDMRRINELQYSYDGIVNDFGLPYLSKEETIDFLKNCSNRLNKGGLLYISFMEDNYANSNYATSSTGEKILFTYYHEFAYISSALVQYGFEIIYTDRKGIDGEQKKKDLVIIAQLNR